MRKTLRTVLIRRLFAVVPSVVAASCYSTKNVYLDDEPDTSDHGDTDGDSDSDADGDADTDEVSCEENAYSGGGAVRWAVGAGGAGMEAARGVAVLSGGTVVVTGRNTGEAVFGEDGPQETTVAGGFLAAYSGDGDLAWARPICEGSCAGNGVAAFTDGAIAMAGSFEGTALFGAGDLEQIEIAATGTAGFAARHGADGRLVWARGIAADGGAEGNSIAAADDGAVLVLGTFSGSAIFGVGAAAQIEREASSDRDLFLARFEADGEVGWVVQAGPVQPFEFDLGIAGGDVFVAGDICAPLTIAPGEPDEAVVESECCGSFLARFSASGGVEWAKRLDGASADFGLGIAPAAGGAAVYVAACFYGAQTFGAGEPGETELACENHSECALLARYDGAGALDWVVQVAGGNWGNGMDVAAFADGSAVTTGAFSGASVFGPGQPAETTLAPDGDNDVFVARYSAAGELLWASRVGGCNPIDWEWGESVAAAPDGSSVVAGGFVGAAVFAEGTDGETEIVSHGLEDLFVARFEP